MTIIKVVKKNIALFIPFACLSLQANAQSLNFHNYNGYIVKIKPGFMVSNFMSNHEINNAEKLNLTFGEYLHIKQTETLTPEQVANISYDDAVEFIEPNYLYSALDDNSNNLTDNTRTKPDYINDPTFKSQWALNNTGDNNWFNDPAGVDINAVNAWKITTGSANIVIAVIDSGIDYNHLDLQANMWVNEKEKNGLPNIDDDNNGYVDDIYGYNFADNKGNSIDDNGHGTEIAGIIGASHNAEGIRGVMGNVKLMSLKFLPAVGKGDTLNAVKAIEYAVNHGAQILNLSWGGGDYSQTLHNALLAASEKNVLIVAAAGNSKNDNDISPLYPASYDSPNIVSVASIASNNQKASFSNYGKKSVHVFTPGRYIATTALNGKYVWDSGTSLSVPMVSGAAGLLLSMHPNLNYAEIKSKIIRTSVQTPDLIKYAQGGNLDLAALLSAP